MGILNMIRNGLRNFLNIEEANKTVININESLSFENNAIKNKVWYRGDSYELDQLYKQIGNSVTKFSFWGASSSPGMEIRKIHTGIPSLIVDKLSSIVITDLHDFEFSKHNQQEIWRQISQENNFVKQIDRALKDVLVIGDGAFRISFDSQVSTLPIVEWVPGDRLDITYKRGRLHEVIFKTFFVEKQKSYTLIERYGYGYIRSELYREDKQISIHDTEYTRQLSDFKFDDKVILTLPFFVGASEKFEGRGKSIFDNKTDTFDALDETWSQWMDALRTGRTKEYIPDELLARNPETGQLIKPNTFDNRFIVVGSDKSESARNEIKLQQAVIPHDSYLVTYVTALDLALQGLISPSTLGIDVKKLDNAEAQREKEKTTLYTRNSLVEALQEYLPNLIYMIINANNLKNKGVIEDVDVNITFGEYANPSFESQVETVAKAKSGGIMSLETAVDELYGDTKDDSWKKEEVERLKSEQGISNIGEPVLNERLGEFDVTHSDDSE